MLGLGLSLMGGVLAQSDDGAGEICYFPSASAAVQAASWPPVLLATADVHRCYTDERMLCDSDVDCTLFYTNNVVGLGVLNINLGGTYLNCGAYFQASSLTQVRAIFWGQTVYTLKTTDFPEGIARQVIKTDGGSSFFKLGDTEATKQARVSEGGNDTTRRSISAYSGARRIRGLFWKSETAKRFVYYMPLADAAGHAAFLVNNNDSNKELYEL